MALTSLKVAPAKCGTCNRPLDAPLFCSNCHALLPADDLGYFELLGVDARFDLDTAALRTRFLERARAMHPDRFPDADPHTQQLSIHNSARLNQAFAVLSDPVSRAEYLLELAGGKPSSQDKRVPPEVLSESLMVREELEEARQASDAFARTRIREQARARRDQRLHRIAELARRLPGDEALRDGLRLELNAIKYDAKMLEQP